MWGDGFRAQGGAAGSGSGAQDLRGCWGADRGEEGKSSHFPCALLNTVLLVCLSPSLP